VYLSPNDQSRAAWHLGLNIGAMVPAGEVARFNEACRRIPDSHWYAQIVEQINRCDRAWAASEVLRGVADTGQMAPSQMQLISGDANRSIQVSDPLRADTIYREIYLRECDRLAEHLVVRNWRREEQRQLIYERSGGAFVKALPGPADTSVGTRIAEQAGLAWA
jgi:hypothetical protein